MSAIKKVSAKEQSQPDGSLQALASKHKPSKNNVKEEKLKPSTPENVRHEATFSVRAKAAYDQYLQGLPNRPDNGDEKLYSNKIGNFSKGLPHDAQGVVLSVAYNAMLHALQTQNPSDFDNIPMGANPSVKLTNPQAGLAFDLEGADVFAFAMMPAPTFLSAQSAGEVVELYNMALMRDVNFDQYDISPLASNASNYLNACVDFRGPKEGNRVTPQTLFRGSLHGCLNGPHVSQFFYQPFYYGPIPVDQKSRQTTVNTDYLTAFPDWLMSQNGVPVAQTSWPDVRYIINARDLAEWVHMDALYQGYHNALLYLLGINCPPNPGNSYINNQTQSGFGTFGEPHILTLLPEMSQRALKAAWNQKWTVHRRCRPEDFCARVHLNKKSLASDPIHSDLLDSTVLSDVHNKWNSYLLPIAYAEGSPTLVLVIDRRCFT